MHTPSRMRKQISRLALPNIVSNITVPLLSLVDVGLAGHLPESGSIGAVAIASQAVATLYWLFGFLRMGTTGYVAQAYGRRDVHEINLLLARGGGMALLFGMLLTVATPLVMLFARLMAQGHAVIATEAQRYISLALLAAPAAMGLYVMNGWLIGMQDTRSPMIGAITINLINIGSSWLLVRFTDIGVAGLAIGTVIAQYIGLVLLIALAWRRFRRVLKHFQAHYFLSLKGMASYTTTGINFLIRSALLALVTLYFTYASTGAGAEVVSANTLLMQLFNLFSYFTDGFAYAGEALTGRYIGMHRPELLRSMIRQLFLIGGGLALLGSLLYLVLPMPLLHLLSDKEEVIAEAQRYLLWVALIPVCGFAAFLWDGIFVGSTYARGLVVSMIIATGLFFGVYRLGEPHWQTHALWVAFLVYLSARSLVQTALWKWKGARARSLY